MPPDVDMRVPAALLIVMFACVSCTKAEPTSRAAPVLSAIAVRLSRDSIKVNEFSSATATGRDQYGAPFGLDTVTWFVGSTEVAWVHSTQGLVTGTSPGQTPVYATSGGMQGSAEITVVPSAYAGTYDITAVTDTFSFEVPGPSGSDCPQPGYCTHRRAYPGGIFAATMTLADKRGKRYEGSGGGDFPMASMTLRGTFCRQWEYGDTSFSCTTVNTVDSLTVPGSWAVDTTSRRFSASFGSGSFSADTYRPYGNVGFDAALSGDSLYGRFMWQRTLNRSPDTQYGPFVARRRK
ncbi:MAG: Ig-like domain-containing protein [Gemmatimonadaceae bacterium]